MVTVPSSRPCGMWSSSPAALVGVWMMSRGSWMWDARCWWGCRVTTIVGFVAVPLRTMLGGRGACRRDGHLGRVNIAIVRRRFEAEGRDIAHVSAHGERGVYLSPAAVAGDDDGEAVARH